MISLYENQINGILADEMVSTMIGEIGAAKSLFLLPFRLNNFFLKVLEERYELPINLKLIELILHSTI